MQQCSYMNLNTYRKTWLKYQKAYEIKSYRIFHKALQSSYNGLNPDGVTYDNYKTIIALNIMIQPIQEAYNEVYRTVGLTHGRRVGFGINREIKRFNNDLFSRSFLNSILDWVRDNVGDRIVSVADTMAKRIGRLVEVALEQGLSTQEMQVFLRRKLNEPSFTRYQALRIARTEVTTASNYAASQAAENSGILLEKIWISTIDIRTRRKPRDQFDHLHMNGQSVGQNEKFVLRSKNGIVDNMDYPGDVKGSAGDIIQCRCTHAFRPKRDENGFAIPV